jgi:hypothetical protein
VCAETAVNDKKAVGGRWEVGGRRWEVGGGWLLCIRGTTCEVGERSM